MNDYNTFSELNTYLNPVYPNSFPDPFVLKYRGAYFAYCTDFADDGKVFGVLTSPDLVNWREIGGAMQKLDSDAPFYWAAEVTCHNGKFYLYYSVGNETLMEIRVAVSDYPDGGFVDAGKKLTFQDFAIDAHVFTDSDGTKYLFYATDFLSHTHIGTGTVVDKMLDFFTLEGNPRPVTRAGYDWQIYDPNRQNKGGVRWHTIEGSFVLKRKNQYYQMFSGGNWQNISYGVSFAVTDDIKKNAEWTQFSDGNLTLPILRTVPDLVIGPGHNSVVRGRNNRELFCVYHRWTERGRVLAIDRMDFVANRIFIKGTTFTPQLAPFEPTFSDYFNDSEIKKNWRKSGEWLIYDQEISNLTDEKSELDYQLQTNSCLCEFSFRVIEKGVETGFAGFVLYNNEAKIGEFLIFPTLRKAVFRHAASEQQFTLPGEFNYFVYHHLRIEIDFQSFKILLDDYVINFQTLLSENVTNISLLTENIKMAFSNFELTEGFEDLFEWQTKEFSSYGWQKLTDDSICYIKNNQLFLSGNSESEAIIVKGEASENFEFAANICLNQILSENFGYGFLILDEQNQIVLRLSFEKHNEKFYLAYHITKIELPEQFTEKSSCQFRFIKLGEKLFLESEEVELGEIIVPNIKLKIGFFCQNVEIGLEMVRLTVLSK